MAPTVLIKPCDYCGYDYCWSWDALWLCIVNGNELMLCQSCQRKALYAIKDSPE